MNTAEQSRFARNTAGLLVLMIVCGAGVRLYRITETMLGPYDWRYYDTAAIARNFYEGGMHFLYPQVDWRGSSPGYADSEFPVYTYSVAILYHLSGVHEWIGRALNAVLVYSLSALVLFRLVRRLLDSRTALLAAFLYSFTSTSLYFTRTFQPDPLMALCQLASLYSFLVWTEEGRARSLVLSAAALALAVAIKPVSLCLGAPLLYLAWWRFGWRLVEKPSLWLFAAGVFTLPGLWYWHSYNLWKLYGNSLGMFGGWIQTEFFPPTDWIWRSLSKMLAERIVAKMAAVIGFPFLVIGIFRKPLGGNYVLHWWAGGFFVLVLTSPVLYRAHEYYELPLVFLTSAWMAYGASWLWETPRLAPSARAALLCALCVGVLALSAVFIRRLMLPMDDAREHMEFGRRVEQLTGADQLVVFVKPRLPFIKPQLHYERLYQHRTAQGERLFCDPVDFYLSHRKGFSLDDSLLTADFLEVLRRRGARYFATFYPQLLKENPQVQAALDRDYTPLEVTTQWAIYRLDDPAQRGERSGGGTSTGSRAPF
jgi:4-amino-4-deoxy-L-arabinose transferase-like glycosyltransferase